MTVIFTLLTHLACDTEGTEAGELITEQGGMSADEFFLTSDNRPTDKSDAPPPPDNSTVIATVDVPMGGQIDFIDEGGLNGISIVEHAPNDTPDTLGAISSQLGVASPLEIYLALADTSGIIPEELVANHEALAALGDVPEEPRQFESERSHWPSSEPNPSSWGGLNCTSSSWTSSFNSWASGAPSGNKSTSTQSGDTTAYFSYYRQIYAGVCVIKNQSTKSGGVRMEYYRPEYGTWNGIISTVRSLDYGERYRYYNYATGCGLYRRMYVASAGYTYRLSGAWDDYDSCSA